MNQLLFCWCCYSNVILKFKTNTKILKTIKTILRKIQTALISFKSHENVLNSSILPVSFPVKVASKRSSFMFSFGNAYIILRTSDMYCFLVCLIVLFVLFLFHFVCFPSLFKNTDYCIYLTKRYLLLTNSAGYRNEITKDENQNIWLLCAITYALGWWVNISGMMTNGKEPEIIRIRIMTK